MERIKRPPVANRDLWETLFGLVWSEDRRVTFVWIKGHAGDPNNAYVDHLSRVASRRDVCDDVAHVVP